MADAVGGAARTSQIVSRERRRGRRLVMFSADKLLGGPQAGVIAGGRRSPRCVRRHPLMRALRADKLTYAALEATLEEHARPLPRGGAGGADDGVVGDDSGSRAEALAAALTAVGWSTG